jgi:hypothetical protein
MTVDNGLGEDISFSQLSGKVRDDVLNLIDCRSDAPAAKRS